MRGALRPIFAVVLALPVGACAGEIELGTNRDASLTTPDTGVPRDGGVLPDTGVVDGGPDGGVLPDTGVDGGGGGGCPAAWPFARDKATYKAKLWDWASVQPGVKCNSTVCHGGSQPPLIPANEADLDTPATLDTAIDALYATMKPTLQPEGVTAPGLAYRHKATAAGGPGETPEYSATQQQFVDALITEACP